MIISLFWVGHVRSWFSPSSPPLTRCQCLGHSRHLSELPFCLATEHKCLARHVYPRSWPVRPRISPSARPVYPRSLLLENAQHLLKHSSWPSSRLLCLPLCRKAAPRSACRRTPLLRVNYADAAAVAKLPPAFSASACLPVVPDKPRLCTPVVGPVQCIDAARDAKQFDQHSTTGQAVV